MDKKLLTKTGLALSVLMATTSAFAAPSPFLVNIDINGGATWTKMLVDPSQPGIRTGNAIALASGTKNTAMLKEGTFERLTVTTGWELAVTEINETSIHIKAITMEQVSPDKPDVTTTSHDFVFSNPSQDPACQTWAMDGQEITSIQLCLVSKGV